MFKIIVVLLALLGAALYFPSTRPVVLETAAPILDPVLRWSTRGEMNRLARDLEQMERTSRRLPEPREQWPAWLEREYQGGEAALDAWGTPYAYILWPDSFAILSHGPDQARGSGDDVRVSRPRLYPAR